MMLSPDDPKVLELVNAAFVISSPATAAHRSTVRSRALAIGAREIDARMFAQQGAFTIHGDRADLADAAEDTSHPWKRMFRIPRESKADLSTLLLRLSIHKSSLFPDLGALAEDLKARRFVQPFDGSTSPEQGAI